MIPKECEEQFQIELRKYRLNENKRSWDLMWFMVQYCCSNIAKSKLKGVTCPDFDGKVLDATLKCMQKRKGNCEDHDGNTIHYCIITRIDSCNLYSYKTHGI